MEKFNKALQKIPIAQSPNSENRKGFFVNSMLPYIIFNLRRERVIDVDAELI